MYFKKIPFWGIVNLIFFIMVDLNSLVVDGCQPFDEGLLDEADMSEILGGNKDVYIYNESKCEQNFNC